MITFLQQAQAWRLPGQLHALAQQALRGVRRIRCTPVLTRRTTVAVANGVQRARWMACLAGAAASGWRRGLARTALLGKALSGGGAAGEDAQCGARHGRCSCLQRRGLWRLDD
ncbi:hypothetical protein GUF72_03030 [Xanthomonas citri pv. citri]|nr:MULTISPECIES: hypothetical protein [Xanthomonas]OOW52979.1 hypothetical protein Xcnt_11210 [Xanthomonas campestris pv. centellae]OOW88616.1 hypothetical protein Xvtf_12390 [Xanthomonas campestris pv. vitistrifoliae]AKM27059.1 hypothetical protein AB890_21260 [Xanthomonas citri pv. citri]AOY61131.1 hypothetical protein BHE84_02475 [Xanthomonas citri pv. glycines str. 8ra]ARV25314.1 hypothetical protein A9D66_22590 [Xanthomonas citri pv. glycines str. 12-2]